MAYDFTPTGNLAADLEKIYVDANGVAKPMTEADMAGAQAEAILEVISGQSFLFEDSVANIKTDGVASVGTSQKTVRSDHVHPSDTTKVSKTGDETIEGVKTFDVFPVTPSSAPVSDYQVANKKYVDNMRTAKIIPVADGTDAIVITKADGITPVFTIDTTNNKIYDSNGAELINKNQAVATALIFG